MNDFSSYDAILLDYISNTENFMNEFSIGLFDSASNFFVLSLKNMVNELEKRYPSNEIDFSKMEDIDQLFFLEGKIKNLMEVNKKEIFSKTQNQKKNEFTTACNQALAIYPYAFFAAKGLLRLFRISGKQKTAYELLKRVWEHGFQSEMIVDPLVLLSAINKDWEKSKEYLAVAQPLFFRLLLFVYICLIKYNILFIANLVTVIIVLLVKPWLIILGIIFLLLLLLGIFSYFYKSEILYLLSVGGILQVVVIFLGKLFITFLI